MLLAGERKKQQKMEILGKTKEQKNRPGQLRSEF
jgi:nucleoside diphosphate kinase